MAGIYIHIPFCKSRCVYCGFYSTTYHSLQQKYVDALCREMEQRMGSDEWQEPWETIYIGGGTPSCLTEQQLVQIFEHIDYSKAMEITMECNPDDVTAEYAEIIGMLPINRVSMGAQTFDDDRLKFLNRRHNSKEVFDAVDNLRKAGIGNISIDLMYGFPGETMDDWNSDITKALSIEAEHLSAYCLMYEEGTPLYRMMEEGKVAESNEETTREMYYNLIDRLATAGYKHYEISNFTRDGFRSMHNSSYWTGIPYIGIGAAAHSYNKTNFDKSSNIYNKVYRQWNAADIRIYINKVENGEIPMEREVLDLTEQYNDMMMLALRTCEGIDIRLLEKCFGTGMKETCLCNARKFVNGGLLEIEGDRLRLTRDGLYVSDMVMSELMKV